MNDFYTAEIVYDITLWRNKAEDIYSSLTTENLNLCSNCISYFF